MYNSLLKLLYRSGNDNNTLLFSGFQYARPKKTVCRLKIKQYEVRKGEGVSPSYVYFKSKKNAVHTLHYLSTVFCIKCIEYYKNIVY